MDKLVATFSAELRSEFAASEKRVLERMEALLRKPAMTAKAAALLRKQVRGTIQENLQISSTTAQHMLKSTETELMIKLSVDATETLCEHLKTALLPGGEKIFQWVIRSEELKQQRAAEPAIAADATLLEKVAGWAAIVCEQCEEAITGSGEKRRLPPGCKLPFKRPRREPLPTEVSIEENKSTERDIENSSSTSSSSSGSSSESGE